MAAGMHAASSTGVADLSSATGTTSPTSDPQVTGADHAQARFRSVLFDDQRPDRASADPRDCACLADLNLDQVFAEVVGKNDAYDLAGFFRLPLRTIEAVVYRQQVFADLERPQVREAVGAFAEAMRTVRQHLQYAHDRIYDRERQRWRLDAACEYCEAASTLARRLDQLDLRSEGLLGLRGYLLNYIGSDGFTAVDSDAHAVRSDLDALQYNVLIKGARVVAGRYDDEPDYTTAVLDTFARFAEGPGKSQLQKSLRHGDIDRVEAQVTDLVAQLFPEAFAHLDAFCQDHHGFVDDVVDNVDRELQFYLSYLEHIAPLRAAGLTLSAPTLSTRSKQENANGTFDIALAAQLVGAGKPLVCNDFHLSGPERILVVSGPNNGGKTTMARTFGQLHYLAGLGCPVPGQDVRLLLCDRVLAHFEREEDATTEAGKLQEELDRLHEQFEYATTESVIILNEMFTSTSLLDALFLSEQMLQRVTDLDALGVCVTFLDELAQLNEKTVSMVSTVVPEDPATRTYRLVRKPPAGKAFALALAAHHKLTYQALTARIGR